jgi:hypothetical protein
MMSGSRIFLFVFLLLSAPLMSQDVTVHGVVADSRNEIMYAGNVVIYSFPDTTFITGTAIEAGRFSVKAPIRDSVVMKCNVMGYEPQWYTLIRGERDSIDCDTLHMNTTTLKAVDIIAMAPVVKNEGSKLSVDVANSSLSAAGTAYEVLENTPGLTIGTDGNVTVFGKGTAMLYLDGQRIPAEMLRSVPSVTIERVEIIKNPPASYDAQGRAVVNIVTKKGAMEGYNIDLFQQVSYTNLFNDATIDTPVFGYTGINAYRRKNKWTVTGRMGMQIGNRWENTTYVRSFVEDSVQYVMNNTIAEERRIRPAMYPGFTFQYRPDTMSHFDLSTTFSITQNYKTIDNINNISADSVQSTIKTSREDENKNYDEQATLSYTRTLDSLGSEIYTSVSFTNYNSRRLGNISQDVATPAQSSSDDLRNNSLNTIRFGVGQFNWTKYLDSAWKIETGVKYTTIINASEVRMQRLSGSDWVDDSTILNSFSYREQTAASFLQGTYERNKWFITAGLRAEFSATDGKSLTYDRQMIDTTYLNVFPMAQLVYTIIEDLNFELDYSWSLERPDFEDLDPFIMYIDSLSYMVGNPNLRPEYTHDFSTQIIYLEAASIGFNYSYTANGMEMFVERTGPNNSQFVAQTRNFDYVKTIGGEIAIPYQNKWWTTYNSVGYNHSIYHYEDGEDYAHNDAEGWFFFVYDKFTVKQFSLELQGWYTTGQPEGLFFSRPISSARVSLMYKSKDNNFTARLIFNDMFYMSNAQADSRIPGFDLYYKEAGDSRHIRAAVFYRFGRVKQQELDNRSNNDSERNRIKG